MLGRRNRLTSGAEFSRAVHRGRRAGTSTLVLHLGAPTGRHEGGVRVGFVVGRQVGPAVTRNRVRRRLRHIARARLASIPAPALLVVRALPAAGSSPFARLADDFDTALGRLGGTR